MEYHKYLKYKTKYLQLKQKIERIENNEDSNMIIPALSPLQHMRINTYENEQEGGLTFLTGYYAFFCNSKHFEYINNGNAPNTSDIISRLAFKGYSYKLYTARTVGRLGRAQGTKLNLVTPIFTREQAGAQQFIDNHNEDNTSVSQSLFHLVEGLAYAGVFILTCVTFGVAGVPFILYKKWQKKRERDKIAKKRQEYQRKENFLKELETILRNYYSNKNENIRKAAEIELQKKHPSDFEQYKKDKEEEKKKLIKDYHLEFISINQLLIKPCPKITKVTENNKVITFYEVITSIVGKNKNVEVDKNVEVEVDNFLNEILKELNTKSFRNLQNIENDIINYERIIKSNNNLEVLINLYFKIEELNRIKNSAEYKKKIIDVNKYNEDNKIDCCIIIDKSVTNNKFIKLYKPL
jgi:hypothetical protein